MPPNPYASPASDDRDRLANAMIQYRVFSHKSFTWKLTSDALFDSVRRAAQHAIEHEIGPERVISVNETGGVLERFRVVVWYRA